MPGLWDILNSFSERGQRNQQMHRDRLSRRRGTWLDLPDGMAGHAMEWQPKAIDDSIDPGKPRDAMHRSQLPPALHGPPEPAPKFEDPKPPPRPEPPTAPAAPINPGQGGGERFSLPAVQAERPEPPNALDRTGEPDVKPEATAGFHALPGEQPSSPDPLFKTLNPRGHNPAALAGSDSGFQALEVDQSRAPNFGKPREFDQGVGGRRRKRAAGRFFDHLGTALEGMRETGLGGAIRGWRDSQGIREERMADRQMRGHMRRMQLEGASLGLDRQRAEIGNLNAQTRALGAGPEPLNDLQLAQAAEIRQRIAQKGRMGPFEVMEMVQSLVKGGWDIQQAQAMLSKIAAETEAVQGREEREGKRHSSEMAALGAGVRTGQAKATVAEAQASFATQIAQVQSALQRAMMLGDEQEASRLRAELEELRKQGVTAQGAAPFVYGGANPMMAIIGGVTGQME